MLQRKLSGRRLGNLKQDSEKTNAEFIFLFQNFQYPFDPENKTDTYSNLPWKSLL